MRGFMSLEGPFPLEGDLVEEAKCRNGDVY
jgi:hypothetical protein